MYTHRFRLKGLPFSGGGGGGGGGADITGQGYHESKYRQDFGDGGKLRPFKTRPDS